MHIINLVIEIVFGIALFINGIIVIPQIIKLRQIKNSNDLSFPSFFGFWLLQMIFFLHGYFYKDYMLMSGMAFAMIPNGVLVFQIIYYRQKNLLVRNKNK